MSLLLFSTSSIIVNLKKIEEYRLSNPLILLIIRKVWLYKIKFRKNEKRKTINSERTLSFPVARPWRGTEAVREKDYCKQDCVWLWNDKLLSYRLYYTGHSCKPQKRADYQQDKGFIDRTRILLWPEWSGHWPEHFQEQTAEPSKLSLYTIDYCRYALSGDGWGIFISGHSRNSNNNH